MPEHLPNPFSLSQLKFAASFERFPDSFIYADCSLPSATGRHPPRGGNDNPGTGQRSRLCATPLFVSLHCACKETGLEGGADLSSRDVTNDMTTWGHSEAVPRLRFSRVAWAVHAGHPSPPCRGRGAPKASSAGREGGCALLHPRLVGFTLEVEVELEEGSGERTLGSSER